MIPDGRTRCFAVLGHPVSHSLSPAMHNASLRSLDWNAIYLAYDVRPEHVASALQGMLYLGFGGVNVTIPLKHAAFDAMRELAPCAARTGVVNTVSFVDGTLTGYNTDGEGLLTDLREQFDFNPQGRSALILGCGGAGRAAALALADAGVSVLWLANRNVARAYAVAENLEAMGFNGKVSVVESEPDLWASVSREANLVLNCTSAGMQTGAAPLLEEYAFRAGQFVYDMVYTTPLTPFLASARRAGAQVANGLGMLLHQGAASFRIWTGEQADTAAMRQALSQALTTRT